MNIRRSELPFAALMAGQFFLIISSFWMLKPLKKGLFVEHYDVAGLDLLGWHLRASQAELVAKLANVAVAFAAMALFSWLSRRFRRQFLTVSLLAVLMVGYAAFAFALRDPGGGTLFAFYVFGDLFNMLMVGSFFAFLNDAVDRGQARRIYGPIVLGGVLGGAFGSMVVRATVGSLAPSAWMWIGMGAGVAIGALTMAAGSVAAPRRAVVPEIAPEAGRGARALDGISLVFRSRYLLSIMAIVGLYEVVSTLVDFQFTEALSHYLDGPSIREHLSTVYLATNAVAVAIQLLGTGYVMNRLGVSRALLVLPAVILLGAAGFAVLPVLALGSFLSVADNGLNYSINQSAKEALYVPCSTAEKYRAKAFIDLFVQRFAKAGGVVVGLVLSAVFVEFASVRWLSVATVILAALWIAAARYAGKRFEPPEREEPATGIRDAEGA